MGQRFFDQYSLLHFATGVLAYFWGFSFVMSFVAHTLFEIIENTPMGVEFINKKLAGIWPGGKPAPDGLTNIVGDTVFFVIGWIASQQLDIYGINHAWY
jgi:hypothetical protein